MVLSDPGSVAGLEPLNAGRHGRGLDLRITGLTIVQAAQSINIPVVISFTVETDGRLPNGDALSAALEKVDAATDNSPPATWSNART